MSYSDDKVLKACDYITLNIRDATGYKNLTDDILISNFSWAIPKGAYRTVISVPQVTTVELVAGSIIGDASMPPVLKLEYLNPLMNQYVTSGAPVLAYGNNISNNKTTVLESAGEFVVSDRPDFINLRLTPMDDAYINTIDKGDLEGMSITLKFAYYTKKEF